MPNKSKFMLLGEENRWAHPALHIIPIICHSKSIVYKTVQKELRRHKLLSLRFGEAILNLIQ
jgi:hypothetical protein